MKKSWKKKKREKQREKRKGVLEDFPPNHRQNGLESKCLQEKSFARESHSPSLESFDAKYSISCPHHKQKGGGDGSRGKKNNKTSDYSVSSGVLQR